MNSLEHVESSRPWGRGSALAKIIIGLAAVLVLAAFSCSEPSSPTTSGSAAARTPARATGDATGQPPQPADLFIEFAKELDSALRATDAGFLAARLLSHPVECQQSDVPQRLGGPQCNYVGETFQGFGVGRWRSEGGIVPVDGVEDQLAYFITAARPSEKDAYGSGAPSVYAIDIESNRWVAIITAIIVAPTGIAGRDLIRVALGTNWVLVDGQWRMTSVMNNYFFASEFLDPSPEVRTGLYPGWRRFTP